MDAQYQHIFLPVLVQNCQPKRAQRLFLLSALRDALWLQNLLLGGGGGQLSLTTLGGVLPPENLVVLDCIDS